MLKQYIFVPYHLQPFFFLVLRAPSIRCRHLSFYVFFSPLYYYYAQLGFHARNINGFIYILMFVKVLPIFFHVIVWLRNVREISLYIHNVRWYVCIVFILRIEHMKSGAKAKCHKVCMMEVLYVIIYYPARSTGSRTFEKKKKTFEGR